MATKELPKDITIEGSKVYYGDILLATLHDELELKADPKELLGFAKRNAKRVWAGRIEDRLRTNRK